MPLDLSLQEEALASQTWVHLVWYFVVEPDETGYRVGRWFGLSIHRTPEDARAEADRRKDGSPPGLTPGGSYHVVGPWNLLALVSRNLVDSAVIRNVLRNQGSVELVPLRYGCPWDFDHVFSARPLTQELMRQAGEPKFWIVWYEEHRGDGSRRYIPTDVCFSKPEADALAAGRGGVISGWGGYIVIGPSPLLEPNQKFPQFRDSVVRDALERLAAGQPGPVSTGMPSGIYNSRKETRSRSDEPCGLHWLEKELKEGTRPSQERLLMSTVEEFLMTDYPCYELCAIAAALLGNLELWRRAVSRETGREHSGYSQQRGMGVFKSDIGDVPTYESITRKLRRTVERMSSQWNQDLAAEILKRLSGFAEADQAAHYE